MMLRSCLSLLSVLVTSLVVYGKLAFAAAPTLVIAPPLFLAVDPDSQRLLASELKTGMQQIAQALLTQTSPMGRLAPNATLNAQRLANTYQAGSPQDPNWADYLVQPVVCAIGQHLVASLEAVRLHDGRLAAGVHSAQANPFPKAQIRQATGPFLSANTWADLTTQLRGAFTTAATTLTSPRSDALNLGSSLAREMQSPARGSLSCLSMLLNHTWAAEKQATTSPVAAEAWAFTTRLLGINTLPQRATRQVTIEWIFPLQALALPWNGKARVRVSEGTMAQSMPPALHEETVSVQVQGRQIRLSPLPKLEALLKTEAAGLKLADEPRIIKKDRAWVYVDRGRAWGLRMDDRLIAEDQGVIIKGHVVGYFGPSLGLRTADGRPVSEGAIVYIRKGQAEARPGLSFRFDPTNYPTDWPPRPTP